MGGWVSVKTSSIKLGIGTKWKKSVRGGEHRKRTRLQTLKPETRCIEMLRERWQESPRDRQRGGKGRENQRKGRQKPTPWRGMRDRWIHSEGALPYLAGWLGAVLHRY